jgi:hypothetical protein
VFDKLARPLAPRIVLPVPSSRGKGVLISPTIYGNVLLGPTSEDLQDRTATGTSQSGFDFLLSKGHALMPRLLPPPPAMPNLGEAFVRPDQDAALIARDAEYGASSVSANGSPPARSATPTPPPSRPRAWPGCAAGPAP